VDRLAHAIARRCEVSTRRWQCLMPKGLLPEHYVNTGNRRRIHISPFHSNHNVDRCFHRPGALSYATVFKRAWFAYFSSSLCESAFFCLRRKETDPRIRYTIQHKLQTEMALRSLAAVAFALFFCVPNIIITTVNAAPLSKQLAFESTGPKSVD
jgi:hypothetical protein